MSTATVCLTPSRNTVHSKGSPYDGILYVTDREPATPEDPEKYYQNDRGQVLRAGVAKVEVGAKTFEWETARVISMLKTRTRKISDKSLGR